MKTTKEYIAAYSFLRGLINEVDPMDLISGGAPEDEYDPEISKILPVISKLNNSKEIAKSIMDIFAMQFNEENEKQKQFYLNIAIKWLDYKNKHNNIT